MRRQYFACGLMLTTAIAALLFVERLSFVCFVFAIEATLILFATELLFRRLPMPLLVASEDNCYRLNGSRSARRWSQELNARWKVRTDLLAVFLLVALIGNWLAFFVHSEVIPFPIALNAAQAFDIDSQAWKQNLRTDGIDEKYEQWKVSRVHVDREVVKSQQELLWVSWPGLVCVGLAWAIGSVMLLGRAYVKIVREFAAGIAARTQANLNRDITRLQHS